MKCSVDVHSCGLADDYCTLLVLRQVVRCAENEVESIILSVVMVGTMIVVYENENYESVCL